MKILNVTQNYFPSVGGPQHVMQQVSERMESAYGAEVQVATSNSLFNPESELFQQVEPAFEIINGVPVHRLPFNRWHYPIIKYSNKIKAKLTGSGLPHAVTSLRSGLDSPSLKKMMLTTDADVIMATTILYNFCDYPMWRVRSRRPKPFILYGALHLHKPVPATSVLIERAKACDVYVANTEYERQELIKYGVDPSRILAIGIGVDAKGFEKSPAEIDAFRKKIGVQEDEVLIGYIGRLVRGKGVAILIDAFRKLCLENKKVKLLLAGGSTEYSPVIKQIIASENLPIILVENFREEEKAILFNALDVFVMGSQSESFGIVYIEAGACRKPVVATEMGAIASVVRNEKDGLLFKPGDVDHLSFQLKRLVADSTLRTAMGNNGFAKVTTEYSWSVIMQKYRHAYELAIETFKSSKPLTVTGR